MLAAPLGLAHRLENPRLAVSGLGKQSQIRENVLGNCSTAQEGGCRGREHRREGGREHQSREGGGRIGKREHRRKGMWEEAQGRARKEGREDGKEGGEREDRREDRRKEDQREDRREDRRKGGSEGGQEQ